MKRSNVFGVPIYKRANYSCQFFNQSGVLKSQEDKFDECTCPIAKVFLRENSFTSIISCADNPAEECSLYQSQNKKDITKVQKYIEKYAENGWILFTQKHWNQMKEKFLSVKTDEYLDLLLKYFGYHRTTNNEEKVDGILYNNSKIRFGAE